MKGARKYEANNYLVLPHPPGKGNFSDRVSQSIADPWDQAIKIANKYMISWCSSPLTKGVSQ
jgi:hypothetical protein